LLHGDLNKEVEPLQRPVWLQPLLQAVPFNWAVTAVEERLPLALLPVQAIRQAVEAVIAQPNAPRVFVLGVSDPYQGFQDQLSPLARLLDWLSLRYNLLFLVPAGNVEHPLDLGLTTDELYALQGSEHGLQIATLRTLLKRSSEQRILSPAEAINVVTVGASHSDQAPLFTADHRIDVLQQATLGSPISRQGPGYLHAVKPDVLFPGGRQLFTDQFYLNTDTTLLAPAQGAFGQIRPPGLRVAAVSNTGEPAVSYACGTELATALAGRFTARLLEAWPATDNPPDSVLLKAFLAHTAQRGTEWAWLRKRLEAEAEEPMFAESDSLRNWLNAYLGFGIVNPEVLPSQSSDRVLLVHSGILSPDEALQFSIPLPPEAYQASLQRHMFLTLAWHSPVEPRGGPYRTARLWAEWSARNPLGLKPMANYGRHNIRRGTLWHETAEANGSVQLTNHPELEITIHCRAAHRTLPLQELIPFAVCITLTDEHNLSFASHWYKQAN
jgi:hypothetical protein